MSFSAGDRVAWAPGYPTIHTGNALPARVEVAHRDDTCELALLCPLDGHQTGRVRGADPAHLTKIESEAK